MSDAFFVWEIIKAVVPIIILETLDIPGEVCDSLFGSQDFLRIVFDTCVCVFNITQLV